MDEKLIHNRKHNELILIHTVDLAHQMAALLKMQLSYYRSSDLPDINLEKLADLINRFEALTQISMQDLREKPSDEELLVRCEARRGEFHRVCDELKAILVDMQAFLPQEHSEDALKYIEGLKLLIETGKSEI